MRTTLENISPLPRTHWAVVTCPRAKALPFGEEATFVADDGRRFRAVRGSTKGRRTIFRIQATMAGGEKVSGRLVTEIHANSNMFRAHPWVGDDVAALIPRLNAESDGVRACDLPFSGPRLLSHSAAHQRWWLKRAIRQFGLVFEFWADLYHDDPVVLWWGKVVWSDRMDSRTNRTFDNLVIQSGEYLALNFAKRHGALEPIRLSQGWALVLSSAPLTLVDGSGLPLSGTMLTYGDPSIVGDAERDLANLRAGAEGPIRGICTEWDGDWLAARNIPRGEVLMGGQEAWQRFLDQQKVSAGWFADRPLGLGKTPSQTGGQEDFGATKGTYAVLGDPRQLQILEYSVQAELFRGTNHYGGDFEPITAEGRPNWTTWSGITHYSSSVASDRLGKEPHTRPGTGWWGYDDEHRSQNNLAAYLMLTDDPLMEDQLRHMATVDLASYRMRYPRNGNGAARAQGRTFGAWAQFVGLSDGELLTQWAKIIDERMAVCAANPTLHVPGPMKALATGNPDPRKLVFRPDGSLGPWISMWEHGLAAVGIYNVVKAFDPRGGKEVLEKVCLTLAKFGCFEYEGRWWIVSDCLWSDGEAPPGEMTPVNRGILSTLGAGGVNTWTFAGLLVAREFLEQRGTEPALLNKLKRCIDYVTRGELPGDLTSAEWWAAVKSTTFPVL